MTGVGVWLGIGVAGAAGSAARFLLHGAVARRRGHPLGTFAVNLTGTLALGVLVGATLHGDAYRIAATGFLGAYTTFSAWMLASYRQTEGRQRAGVWANIVISLLTGIAAIVVGRHVGRLL